VPDNALPTAVYASQTGLSYAPVASVLPVRRNGVPNIAEMVRKTEIADIVAEFSPYEKMEGVALFQGQVWVIVDNDGGQLESRLRYLGQLPNRRF